MKVRCTRSIDGRYKVGKIYPVDKDGQIFDEHGSCGMSHPTDSFQSWFKDCNWTDYEFELVEESKMFTKDDIRSGDKIWTSNGHGIVVALGDRLIIRYSDGGWDDAKDFRHVTRKAIRPAREADVGADREEYGNVVLDLEAGIGCEPPMKEISVSEAEKALTEKFGKAVRIRVGE